MKRKFHIMFSDDGAIVGRYDFMPVPKGATQVDEELFHRTYREKDGIWKYDSVAKKVIKLPMPEPSLDELKDNRKAEIKAEGLALVDDQMGTDPHEKLMMVAQFARDPSQADIASIFDYVEAVRINIETANNAVDASSDPSTITFTNPQLTGA